MSLSFIHCKFLAQLRLGALPICLETGRYERPILPIEDRLCEACADGISVEDEEHLIFRCVEYHSLRQVWQKKITVPEHLDHLPIEQKFKIILNDAANVKTTSQFIIDSCNL